MKASSILNKNKRDKYFSKISKALKSRLSTRNQNTIPLFIFGQQRSGTTMLMDCFHFHPEIEVFDERANSKAFFDFRLREFDKIKTLESNSRFPFVCFKSLADSHIASDIIREFPNGKYLWTYRDYRDVANSYLRKFPHATEAIKKVIKNQPGGGWFQEGVSDKSAEIIRKIYTESLTEYDLSCLAWWVRNQIFIEQELFLNDSMLVIRYDLLVKDPKQYITKFLKELTIPEFRNNPYFNYVHQKSISKNPHPEINPQVKSLCDDLMESLQKFTFT